MLASKGQAHYCAHDLVSQAVCASTPAPARRREIFIIRALLRAGASTDARDRDGQTVEEILQKAELVALDECLDSLVAIRTLVGDVRRAGSWRSYCIVDHRDVLVLRTLIARGRAHATAETEGYVKNLLNPNLEIGVVWHVLTFWKDDGTAWPTSHRADDDERPYGH